MDGEIGEHLAVHLDASLGEAVDKSRIGQAVLADTGIDTLDPERTEVALPGAAVAITPLLTRDMRFLLERFET